MARGDRISINEAVGDEAQGPVASERLMSLVQGMFKAHQAGDIDAEIEVEALYRE
jgi:hypothetical protein